MGLNIEDGKGRGNQAAVNNENRILASTVGVTAEHHANHEYGKAFNLVFSQSPTAADDCIAYILNSDDTDMVIEGVTIGVTNATADDSIYFKIGDSGTRNSATDVTPVNMNGASANNAVGTFEKGADLDGGSATLAGGVEFNRFVLAGVTDLTSKYFNFEQDLILPKNKAITIWVGGSATGTYYITLHFNYHENEE
jgi:hypothetical protein